jgi:hypothetical protein
MRQGAEKEFRVREIAYLLWQREGHPHGEDQRHWLEAEALFEAEQAERKATEGEPPGDNAEQKKAKTPASAKKVSAAAAKASPTPAKASVAPTPVKSQAAPKAKTAKPAS